MQPGQSFESADVANYYQFRPDYPDDLYQQLIALAPRHQHALDLGCGNGKIARRISRAFERVIAVDPSQAMLEAAKRLQTTDNVTWVCSRAEDSEFADTTFDLIVAGASIHWMDHAVLFPRLLNHIEPDHVFAVVDGDGAHQPPWQGAWDEFLSKWILELTGERYEPNRADSPFAQRMARHRKWLAIEGETRWRQEVTQSVDDFIACQYSRATFTPARLGTRIETFTEELRKVISPYADSKGNLTYQVESKAEWGKIRL